MNLSKKLIVGLLVYSITLCEARAASSCSADIESASHDLADASYKVVDATKVCQGGYVDKTKCNEALLQVVWELNTASTDV